MLHGLLVGKDIEIASLEKRLDDLQLDLALTPLPKESSVEEVQGQLRAIQRQHMELLSKTKSRESLPNADLDKFYKEIGMYLFYENKYDNRKYVLTSPRNNHSKRYH